MVYYQSVTVRAGGSQKSGDGDNCDKASSTDTTLVVSVVETYGDDESSFECDSFLDSLLEAMYDTGLVVVHA